MIYVALSLINKPENRNVYFAEPTWTSIRFPFFIFWVKNLFCHAVSDIKRNQIPNFMSKVWQRFSTVSGLILTTYCVRYPHAVPFLRNKVPFFLLKAPKAHAVLGGGGCSILNALNLEKWGVKTHNWALLLDFLAFLVIPHACW